METTTKKETYVNFLEGIFTGADDVDGRGSLNKNPSRARAVLAVRYSRVCVCVDIFSCEFCLFFSSSSFPYFVLYMYTHTKRSGGGERPAYHWERSCSLLGKSCPFTKRFVSERNTNRRALSL